MDRDDTIAPEAAVAVNEFEFADRRDAEQTLRNRQLADQARANARQAALDPNDGIDL